MVGRLHGRSVSPGDVTDRPSKRSRTPQPNPSHRVDEGRDGDKRNDDDDDDDGDDDDDDDE